MLGAEMNEPVTNVVKGLESLLVMIDKLNPDPENARKHNKRNLGAIKASLKNFGMHQPIVVQKQGMIVRVGNARLEAATALGWTHVAAVVVDENDDRCGARDCRQQNRRPCRVGLRATGQGA